MAQRKTPLHEACGAGDVGKAHVLLMSRADINARDSTGSTAMHWAAGNGHVGALRVLFGFGMDTEQTNNAGRTALHDACMLCRPDSVQALLEAGANEDAKGDDGLCAVDLARNNYVGSDDDAKRCVKIMKSWGKKTKEEKEKAITRPVKWEPTHPEYVPPEPPKLGPAWKHRKAPNTMLEKIIFVIALVVLGAIMILAIRYVQDMDANAPFDRRELRAPSGGANIFDLFNGNFEKEYQRHLKKKT